MKPKSFIALTSLALSICPIHARNTVSADSLANYIRVTIPASVRECPVDTLGKFGLPHPYSVPCIRDHFQDMYYWDTYFTNVGLILAGDVAQARNNIDDILAMIERFGFMPNGSNVAFLSRSQPPYASMMVRDIYDITGDRLWLQHADSVLRREYDFWMTRRLSPNGLNRYGQQADNAELEAFFGAIYGRLQRDPSTVTRHEERLETGAHLLAEAESGWDFNPRFDNRCMDFNPVDLNSNLYIYETNFAYFAGELGHDDADDWKRRAESRRALMNSLMTDPDTGLYYDYDTANGCRSTVYSAAGFSPLYAGLATTDHAHAAVASGLPRIEMAHGIAACEDGPRTTIYQWDYPNSWAALNMIVVNGLDRYGYKADALRVATKYRDAILSIFNDTDNLWEKYNAVTGNNDVKNEYGLPGSFMGWTAGAYMYTNDYVNQNH